LLNDLLDQELDLGSQEVLSQIRVVNETHVALDTTFVDLKSTKEDLDKVFIFFACLAQLFGRAY
jgi:hypothetical protein